MLGLVPELRQLLPDVVGAVDLLQQADRRPPVRDLGDEPGEPAGPVQQVPRDGAVELGGVSEGELVGKAVVGEGAEAQGERAREEQRERAPLAVTTETETERTSGGRKAREKEGPCRCSRRARRASEKLSRACL